VRSRCFGSVQANAICSQCRIPWFVSSALALSVAQYGGKHPDAKPWKGLGPGVFEVVSDYKTDTFRAGYVVRFGACAVRLALFQKKSPSGTRTAKTDVEMIERPPKGGAKQITRRGMAKQVKKRRIKSWRVFRQCPLPISAFLMPRSSIRRYGLAVCGQPLAGITAA